MRANLDKWIKDAKDDVPDSGEYRRLNRILLKERMITSGPDRRRHHWVLLVVIILVFLMLLSGQLNQLGSDGFETNTRNEKSLHGDTTTIHENVFRGGSVNLPRDFSEADIDEYHRSVAAGEGSIVMVTGLSYGGKTTWLKFVKRIVNGKENIEGGETESMISEDLDDFLQFYQKYNSDLKAKTATEPPHEIKRMVVDGVMLDFRIWTYEYPGFGKVTRHIGLPVD
jgi:hypothetical protein